MLFAKDPINVRMDLDRFSFISHTAFYQIIFLSKLSVLIIKKIIDDRFTIERLEDTKRIKTTRNLTLENTLYPSFTTWLTMYLGYNREKDTSLTSRSLQTLGVDRDKRMGDGDRT